MPNGSLPRKPRNSVVNKRIRNPVEPLAWYRIAAPIAFVLTVAGLCAIRPLPLCRAMLLGIGMMVGYAVVQDQLSARLCPEYFTVFHNPIPGLSDPTLLGLAWGFLGSWWGGAILGIAAGIASTVGTDPPLPVRQLVRPMLLLMATVGIVAAITGFSAHRHAEFFQMEPSPTIAGMVPQERRHWLFVVACYHFAAYATAILGSVVVCVWIGSTRRRLAAINNSQPPLPQSRPVG